MTMEIYLPPLPLLSRTAMVIAIAGGLLLGVALLLTGRVIHRAFLALAGAGAGFVISTIIAERLKMDPSLSRLLIAIALGIVGMACARWIWAVIAAVLAAGGTSIAVGAYLGSKAMTVSGIFKSADTFGAYVQSAGQSYLTAIQDIWSLNPAVTGAVIAVAGLILLVLFAMMPRLGAVVMTSVAGAVIMVGASLILAGAIRQSLWLTAWQHWYVPASVAVLLVLVGIAFQYQALPSPKPDEDKGGPPDQKKKSEQAASTQKPQGRK